MRYVEDERTELKRELNADFAKEVVAFLNTRDGVIYIGVTDDGVPVGVSDINITMRKIRDIVRDQILPSTGDLVTIGSLLEDDALIIRVEIKHGNKLYYLKKYGRSSTGCFFRDGTSASPLKEEEIEKRFVETYSKALPLDKEESFNQNLTFQKLIGHYIGCGYHIDSESFEKNLNLKNDDGKYNRMAELLADINGLSLKLVIFGGKDKSSLISKSEYGRKCLLTAVDVMLSRLEVINVNSSHMGGAQRTDSYLVNPSSLKEAFINAVVHNDYSISYPAVYLFSDRVEILSYGGLPQGQTEEGFFKGISVPRNLALMDIFSKLDYVEQTGFGVPEIIKHYGRKAFEFGEKYLIVSLPFDEKAVPFISPIERKGLGESKTYKSILRELKKMVKENPSISRTDISRELNLSRRKLDALMKEANITHVGPKNGGHYQIG